jgi:hypothetical protein
MPLGDRPWSEMWSLVQHNLRRIEVIYARGTPPNLMDLKCEVLNFCVSSFHLCDHVRHDPALPSGVGIRVAGRAEQNPAIAAAGDFANTAKHYKRTQRRGQIRPAAQIVRLHSAPSATIRWVDPSNGTKVEKDALRFAREVDVAWRTLLWNERLIPAADAPQ